MMASSCFIRNVLPFLLIVLYSAASAQTCMVSPTEKEVVSGRFGKYRGGGAANFGSANAKPHMHDGLDFSTNNSSVPLHATTDGTIVYMGARGTAGNTILLKRANGDHVAYYHLSGFNPDLKVGSTVKAGQQIGISGNTPSGAMAKHLHFIYGTAQRDDVRAKTFSENARKGPFNPAQLPSVFNQQSGIGYKTDPAPYFCKTYPIQDGHPEHYPILGKDTKEQYAILFGTVPQNGVSSAQFEPVQVAAANSDAVLASSQGMSPVTFLSDGDGYGSLPTAPVGGYETMSPSEMMLTEASRRFSDANWNTEVTRVSSRALWVDYTRAVGVGNYLSEAIYRKKERIEALLALYTSQKMARMRARVEETRAQAEHSAVRRVIQ